MKGGNCKNWGGLRGDTIERAPRGRRAKAIGYVRRGDLHKGPISVNHSAERRQGLVGGRVGRQDSGSVGDPKNPVVRPPRGRGLRVSSTFLF